MRCEICDFSDGDTNLIEENVVFNTVVELRDAHGQFSWLCLNCIGSVVDALSEFGED